MAHLVPRDYQIEAADAACKENRIVNLPTGTGKTLIAALVHERLQSRMTLIVCGSVAVIEQHTQFFHQRGIRNVIVDTAAALMGRIFDYGGLGDDEDFDETDVNAIIMREKRQHVLQKVADVQLVVFDECHHAIGHHPYVKLAKLLCKYKNVDENGNTEDKSTFRILGLTASFIHGSFENISKKRKRLEDNLHAKLWTPQKPESVAALADKNSMKHFYKVEYKAPDARISKKDIEKRSLELMKPVLKTLPYGMAKIVSQEVSKSAYLCYYILGEAGWSFFLRDGLVPYLEAKLRQKAEYVARDAAQQFEIDRRYEMEHDKESVGTSTNSLPTASELEAQRAEYLIPLHRYLQQAIPIIDQLSPKCESLIEILESCTSSVKKTVQVPLGGHFGNQMYEAQLVEEQDQSLIFVERAVLCIPLAKIIEMRTKTATRPVMGVQSMSADTRNATLQDFKNGSLKIIVATSSLEEGIDVADCKVVVRFDYFSTVRSHIQGSGRARHPDAKIFYFEQEPDIEEKKASLMTLAAGNPKMDVPDIEPQTRNMIPGIDDIDDGKKIREPPHLRVREYPSLADCGVGHRFEKEETTWDPIQNKSQRTMECQRCKQASVVIKSRAFGQGRKKKERYYLFGGRDNPWVCKYATPEEIRQAAERQGAMLEEHTAPGNEQGQGDVPMPDGATSLEATAASLNSDSKKRSASSDNNGTMDVGPRSESTSKESGSGEGIKKEGSIGGQYSLQPPETPVVTLKKEKEDADNEETVFIPNKNKKGFGSTATGSPYKKAKANPSQVAKQNLITTTTTTAPLSHLPPQQSYGSSPPNFPHPSGIMPVGYPANFYGGVMAMPGMSLPGMGAVSGAMPPPVSSPNSMRPPVGVPGSSGLPPSGGTPGLPPGLALQGVSTNTIVPPHMADYLSKVPKSEPPPPPPTDVPPPPPPHEGEGLSKLEQMLAEKEKRDLQDLENFAYEFQDAET